MIASEIIEKIIHSQADRLARISEGMTRQVKDFEPQGSNAFIVSGIRRCGKSTWLQQLYKRSSQKAVFINFEDPRLIGFDLSDFNRMHDYRLSAGVAEYYFDEIQNVDQWENFVRFRLDEGFKIYITGSNASMLSRELGTKLTGRYLMRELFPFSYKEFVDFKGLRPDLSSSVQYLETGGFPEYLKSGDTDVLMQVFKDIIIRDIAVRYQIRNLNTLMQVAEWLVSNVGKLITANSLKKTFEIPSSSTITEYLSFLADSYLFFYVPKFSYSHRVQLVNARKIYCIDNGVVFTNSISFTEDTGRLLENAVFIQLRRYYTDIYYYQNNKECDFVVFVKRNLKYIIQVCVSLNESTIDRELKGLLDAMEFFNSSESYLITLQQTDLFTLGEKSIKAIPFYQWASEFV